MTVRVLLFARYRELAGCDSVALDLPEGSTVQRAVDELRGRGGGFAELPERPATAKNQIVVRGDALLADGDELALLPPVAGG